MSENNSKFVSVPYGINVNNYKRVLKIGQGTYGEVFKGVCEKTGQFVALKRVTIPGKKETIPITTIREIKLLEMMDHENVVKLESICLDMDKNQGRFDITQPLSYFIVMEYVEHDLAGLLANKTLIFTQGETKSLAQMMFRALDFLHGNNVIHRDIKSSNILITKKGVLKLADFGLARISNVQLYDNSNNNNSKRRPMTRNVVTLWYRAPELILGDDYYDHKIDIWAAGCITAELYTRCALFNGESEIMQLKNIAALLGPISEKEWPEVVQLKQYRQINTANNYLYSKTRIVRERLQNVIKDPLALDLVDALIQYNPKVRPGANAILRHEFFSSKPSCESLEKTLSNVTFSNYQMNMAMIKNNLVNANVAGGSAMQQGRKRFIARK